MRDGVEVVGVWGGICDSVWMYIIVLTHSVFNVKFLHWFLC